MNPFEPSQETELVQEKLSDKIAITQATEVSEQTHDWTPLQLGIKLYRWSILFEIGVMLFGIILMVLLFTSFESEWVNYCYRIAIQQRGLPLLSKACYLVSIYFLTRLRVTELSYQLFMGAVLFLGIDLASSALVFFKFDTPEIQELQYEPVFQYTTLGLFLLGDICFCTGIYLWVAFCINA